MGILDRFRTPDPVIHDAVTAGFFDPARYPLTSPWSSNNLQRLVFEDIFGSDIPENTRAAAMALPVLARGRNLLVTTIARLPIVSLTGDQRNAEQPAYLTSSVDGSSPQLRIAWTVDDLIFYGWSCWWRTPETDQRGYPLAVGRIAQDEWEIDEDTASVLVNGVPQRPDEVILIPGLHEGILSFGRDAILDTQTLMRNYRNRLANPIPNVELHQTGGDELLPDEIDVMIDGWAAARAGANGGVAFTNEFIEARMHGSVDGQLMIEARNAAAVDIARLLGVTASRLDATADKASLNYETTTGRNLEFVEFDLATYMDPIGWRLSLDDVSPKGERVDFDTTDFTAVQQSATGPTFGD